MREPGGVLGAIIAAKKAEVAARLGGQDAGALRAGLQRSSRSLADALARPGARFIFEVKRASPSAGTLSDAAPEGIARAYRGVADAVSVLTDRTHFGGAPEDIARVRAVYDGPILAKDFVIDPRQVIEARRFGADAVLAMLSVLDDDEARAVIAEAERLGMDVLVEAHDAAELRRAVALGAAIIGINNRDLRTLETDLSVSERLAHLVPDDRLLVSESGVGEASDVRRLARRVDAFLIGTAPMRSGRPGAAARAIAFGPVKICGITNVVDARAAAMAGASIGGLVLVPDTPRALDVAVAVPVAAALKAEGLRVAGVFRDAPIGTVAAAVETLGLDMVQLHGEEDSLYVAALRDRLGERLNSTEILAAGPVSRPDIGADRRLFDTIADGRSGGRSGGTGRTFDWRLLEGRSDLPQAFLAGGLHPGNVAAAAATGAYGLDVGSGVEAVPGRKDPVTLARLFAALRPPCRGDRMPERLSA